MHSTYVQSVLTLTSQKLTVNSKVSFSFFRPKLIKCYMQYSETPSKTSYPVWTEYNANHYVCKAVSHGKLNLQKQWTIWDKFRFTATALATNAFAETLLTACHSYELCVHVCVTDCLLSLFQRRFTGRVTSLCLCKMQRAQQIYNLISEQDALTPCCFWQPDARIIALSGWNLEGWR